METQFILTDEKTIVGVADVEEAPAGSRFASERELGRLLRQWPMRALVELWNGLPGVRAVTKFENRDIAIARLWRELQPKDESVGSRRPKAQRRRKIVSPPKPGSKADRILGLLQQAEGATLDHLMSATGWQAHSVRGFLSNLKRKRSLKIRSRKHEGQRTYLLAK